MRIESVIATAAAALLSTAGHAAVVIDQNQPIGAEYIASFEQSDLAQSFQQANENIAGAGIFMEPDIGSTDTVTISLWDALPNQAGANLLTSGSGSATAGAWFDVFWDPVAIASGSTYYLVFTSLSDTLGISGSINNPYAFGKTYANAGFNPFDIYDYTFRTYYDNETVPSTGQVPTPATALLIGFGFAGLALSRRRFLT